MTAGRVAPVLLVLALLSTTVRATETDQFYAWGRDLPDSAEVLNAKVNSGILLVLDRVNARPSWRDRSCHSVAKRIKAHFCMLAFHEIELWANNTTLIRRIPATPEEELRYRRESIYGNHGPFDLQAQMPPSPTVSVGGIRLGTEKLGHFFSGGWMTYRWYRGGLRRGLSTTEAEQHAIKKGVRLEHTFLGTRASGVFSLADLEANYGGLHFFLGLCDAESPALRKTDDGWKLVEPFDFRVYVTPGWDESYRSSVYTDRRWSKVRPVMLCHCSELASPEVARQRSAYDRQDRVTPTQRVVADLVEAGKLGDPAAYGIEQICAEAAAQARSGAVPEPGFACD